MCDIHVQLTESYCNTVYSDLSILSSITCMNKYVTDSGMSEIFVIFFLRSVSLMFNIHFGFGSPVFTS